MTISLETVIQRVPEIMHSDLGAEVVMMDLDAGTYYGLNAVGARVWAMADNPVALTAVVDELLGSFDVERAECEEAVQAFADDLLERGVVRVIGGTD